MLCICVFANLPLGFVDFLGMSGTVVPPDCLAKVLKVHLIKFDFYARQLPVYILAAATYSNLTFAKNFISLVATI